MSKYWSRYKSFVYTNCTAPDFDQTSVRFWKDRLFASSVVYFIPLCLLALIPSVYLSITKDVMGILIADFVAVGVILGVAFLPNVPVYIRKLLFNGSLYLISVVMFFFLGYDGPGMLYLLAVTVFTVLSMESKYGYIVLALNALICILFGFLIHFNLLNSVLANQYQLDVWIGVSTNLVFLSGTAILLIPHLFKGLQSSFDEQTVLKNKLEESFVSIQHSEQKFKALVQEGFDLIAVVDEGGRYTFVSPAARKVLDLEPEELIGSSVIEYIHPDDQDRLRGLLGTIETGEHVEIAPFRYRNRQGDWLWIESVVTNKLENPAIKGYVINSQDVTDEIIYQKELEESLKEKETLLAEIHHRVKNNLAIITSMMQLQAIKSDKPELHESLQVAQQRIHTIATIHELLYSSESLSYIEFGENITQLVRSIEYIYSGENAINLVVDVEAVPININQAIPCALMVNELVTNAYKHAFKPGQEGTITVELREKKGNVILNIFDNGIGLPDDFRVKSTSSIGMTLIHLLTEQLEAEMELYAQKGTHFKLRFRKAEYKKSGNSFL